MLMLDIQEKKQEEQEEHRPPQTGGDAPEGSEKHVDCVEGRHPVQRDEQQADVVHELHQGEGVDETHVSASHACQGKGRR
jgi:hypothetical protein